MRMSVACPDRALAANSASAIWPRTTPTRSHTPVVEGPLGLVGVLEPAHPDHRELDRLADGAGDEQGIPGRDLHAGLDHVQGGGGHADRGVDVVDLAGGFDHAGHGHRVVDLRCPPR